MIAPSRERAEVSSPKSAAWLDTEHDRAITGLSYRKVMCAGSSPMEPLLGGLITGGASLLGGFMSSTTSAQNTQANIQAQQQMQQQTEQFNAGQAQVARDYQTQMSNTAYQRASQDMQKAGLNPMMMFGSGGPASTPSSPSPSVGSPNMALSQRQSAFAGIGDAVSKAVNSAVDLKTFDRMTQEIANLRTTQRLTEANIRTEAQRPEQVAAQTETEQQRAKLAKLDIPASTFSAKSAEDLLSMPDVARRVGNVGAWGAGKVSDIVTPIVSSALRAKGLGMLRREFDASEAAQAGR